MSEPTKALQAVFDISINNIEAGLRLLPRAEQLALRKYIIGRIVDGTNVCGSDDDTCGDDYIPTEYKRYISVDHDQDLQTQAFCWVATVTYPGSTEKSRIYWNDSSMKELIDNVFNLTPEFIYE